MVSAMRVLRYMYGGRATIMAVPVDVRASVEFRLMDRSMAQPHTLVLEETVDLFEHTKVILSG
jgi:hypothetical protein